MWAAAGVANSHPGTRGCHLPNHSEHRPERSALGSVGSLHVEGPLASSKWPCGSSSNKQTRRRIRVSKYAGFLLLANS